MNGRFGWYLKIGDLNVSLKKDRKDRSTGEITPGDDPATMTLERALELHKEKIEFEANRYIQQWEKEGVDLLRGPYGIYIKSKEKGNIKIPASLKDSAEKLTKKQCMDIVKAAPKGGRKGRTFYGKK